MVRCGVDGAAEGAGYVRTAQLLLLLGFKCLLLPQAGVLEAVCPQGTTAVEARLPPTAPTP